jgi:hypothetical protein
MNKLRMRIAGPVGKNLYISPLAKLISGETAELLRPKMEELDSSLKFNLSIIEYAFLKDMLGHNWCKKLCLSSLEYVDNVSQFVDERLPEIKERLQILISSTINMASPRNKALSLCELPYFLTTKKETIDIYMTVLKDDVSFPAGFFKYDNGRKAFIVTRHMYEVIIGWKPEEVFEKAKKKDFHNNRLGNVLTNNFGNSIKSAIEGAYPRSSYPGLYDGKSKKPTGLISLVDSLDEIFGSDR